MSGGFFDYNQYHISSIAESVQSLILNSGSKELDEYGSRAHPEFSPEILEKFREGLKHLELAAIYAQRIDWLVSGDDGDQTFLKRLEADLQALETKNNALNPDNT